MFVDYYLDLVGFALVVGTLGLVLAVQVRRHFQGLALLLVVAVVTPLELQSGLNGSVALTAFLCFTWVARSLILRRHSPVERSRIETAALVFLAVAILSFVVGQYPWFPTGPAPMRAQIGGLALFLLSGGLFLFVGHQIGSIAQLQRLTWLFIGLGAVGVVTSITSAFDIVIGPVAVADATSIGSVFWTWIVAISVSQALCNRDLSVRWRFVALAVGASAVARGLFLAYSWVSGWLPPLVAVGAILLVRFPKSTIGGALLLVAPVLFLGGPEFNRLLAGESYSSMTRFEALSVMWELIQRNPWLGFGPANYYQYTLLFPILGWWVRFNSHNNYVDLIAQTGIIGLIAFLWFVAEVVRLALRMRARVPSGFAKAYVTGVLAGLAGSLVSGLLADWIIPFTYNVGLRGFRSSLLFWFFLGGLLSLKRITAAAPAPIAVPVRARPQRLVTVRIAS